MDNTAAPHSEKAPQGAYDLESAMGAGLTRQISVQLTHEQFERLYLQPGGESAKGDLSKRVGNPTPLGVASFLLCLTPFTCLLMGWSGSNTSAAVVQVGAYYFIGGLGLFVAGLLEWIIGNTFPATTFMTFGGFWFGFGYLLAPDKLIGTALAGGAEAVQYNLGLAIYLVWWAVLVLIYFIASLRTNVVFAVLFLTLDVQFWLLVVAYLHLGHGTDLEHLVQLLKVAGAFAFIACACGWYLLVVVMFGTTGIPISLPVGDLSNFMTRRPKQL